MVKRRTSSPRVRVLVFALVLVHVGYGAALAGDRTAIDQIRAITSPFYNESADISTEIRPFYMFNVIPSDFVSDGGYIHVVGVQARYAITDRLALLFTKNGYSSLEFDKLLPDSDGPINVEFGAKYAIFARPELSRFLTVGARYEAPVGDVKTGVIRLQGDGSGMLDMFVSWSSMIGEHTALQSSLGFDLAMDPDKDSSFFHYGMHLDHRLFDRFHAVIETNVVATIDNGKRTDSSILGSFEGYDLFNFGSTDSATVATMAFGGRYRFNDHILFGAAYEFPITSRKDIIDQRLTLDTYFVF